MMAASPAGPSTVTYPHGTIDDEVTHAPYPIGFEIVERNNNTCTLTTQWGYEQDNLSLRLDVALKKPQPVNGGFKNLSPKRVKQRRQKKKIAQASKRRNRR